MKEKNYIVTKVYLYVIDFNIYMSIYIDVLNKPQFRITFRLILPPSNCLSQKLANHARTRTLPRNIAFLVFGNVGLIRPSFRGVLSSIRVSAIFYFVVSARNIIHQVSTKCMNTCIMIIVEEIENSTRSRLGFRWIGWSHARGLRFCLTSSVVLLEAKL